MDGYDNCIVGIVERFGMEPIVCPKDLADAIELAVKQIQMTQEPVSDRPSNEY